MLGQRPGQSTVRERAPRRTVRDTNPGPSGFESATFVNRPVVPSLAALDERTLEILERRRQARYPTSRGWLLRRLLLAADLAGVSLAFLLASLAVASFEGHGAVDPWVEFGIFLATLPAWVVAAKLFGLYDRDEFLADHTTLDDFTRVFLLVTLGAFIFGLLTGHLQTSVTRVWCFWIFGILLITAGRTAARLIARRTLAYVQNAVVVGAGDVGQLVARKLLQHPEYGINLVGFVDSDPKSRLPDLRHVTVLGTHAELPNIVRTLGVERVIIAFSRHDPEQTLDLIRSLRDIEVQIDIVPRLFEIVGANAQVHTLEGLPLVGLPAVKISRSSMLIKRTMDIAGAVFLLLVTSPLFAVAAWKIKRESPGPIFYRQRRVGMNQREFTMLKFRTMRIGTDDGPHRAYIEATMAGRIEPGSNGLFKLDRSDAVTPFGRWLRSTSLDELPQLINVLRGDMSLVGPRPCLPYEVEHFATPPFRALPRPGRHDRQLAGDRARPFDLRRGPRDGRAVRAQLVFQPRSLPLPANSAAAAAARRNGVT